MLNRSVLNSGAISEKNMAWEWRSKLKRKSTVWDLLVIIVSGTIVLYLSIQFDWFEKFFELSIQK